MPGWEELPGETKIDISHLKVKGIGTRSELNLHEARNILKVTLKYFGRRSPTKKMAPFDLVWVKRLHREMFKDVWKWAGQVRREDVNLGVKWYLIDEKLQNLLSDLQHWEQSGMDVLERAVRLHHQAVRIHPFSNGNGRWSRMLANIYLRSRDHPDAAWPEDLLGSTSTIRDAYLAAIKASDQDDYDLLIQLHHRYLPTVRGPIIVMKKDAHDSETGESNPASFDSDASREIEMPE
jgi:Fic-DOC domain mobile mystery protein B